MSETLTETILNNMHAALVQGHDITGVACITRYGPDKDGRIGYGFHLLVACDERQHHRPEMSKFPHLRFGTKQEILFGEAIPVLNTLEMLAQRPIHDYQDHLTRAGCFPVEWNDVAKIGSWLLFRPTEQITEELIRRARAELNQHKPAFVLDDA